MPMPLSPRSQAHTLAASTRVHAGTCLLDGPGRWGSQELMCVVRILQWWAMSNYGMPKWGTLQLSSNAAFVALVFSQQQPANSAVSLRGPCVVGMHAPSSRGSSTA